ncbi:MAG: UDP-N-acetylmuramoyl-tripeptide--D-alanyl-D-alanine ligase [Patescibacteria group bacterium]
MKKWLQSYLNKLAKRILVKYQPDIIGVTGSYGKTSTVEAIYQVLATTYSVRKNLKNYNNEIGVPLSIIGKETGGKNFYKWLGVIFKAWSLLLSRDNSYPQILILEMAADHPGDIKYLVKMAPPKVGVITAIGPVHLKFFKKIEKVLDEKKMIVSKLPEDGFAILNADDNYAISVKDQTRAKVLSYGFSEEAVVRASDHLIFSELPEEVEKRVKGVSFKLHYQGNTVPVFLPDVLGRHQIYSALAAAACGISFNVNLVDTAEALKRFQSPKGRMKIIDGIKHTVLIDDSYNSSPVACEAALEVLSRIPAEGKNKFAALGDMAELGEFMEEGHYQVGKKAAKVCDYLVTVGEAAKMMAEQAIKSGMSQDKVFSFGSADRAGRFIQERIKQGDIVLIKGSQVSRMERVVKELMAEPEKANELLVRQGSSWQ